MLDTYTIRQDDMPQEMRFLLDCRKACNFDPLSGEIGVQI